VFEVQELSSGPPSPYAVTKSWQHNHYNWFEGNANKPNSKDRDDRKTQHKPNVQKSNYLQSAGKVIF
jgi:hypothetical protein